MYLSHNFQLSVLETVFLIVSGWPNSQEICVIFCKQVCHKHMTTKLTCDWYNWFCHCELMTAEKNVRVYGKVFDNIMLRGIFLGLKFLFDVRLNLFISYVWTVIAASCKPCPLQLFSETEVDHFDLIIDYLWENSVDCIDVFCRV